MQGAGFRVQGAGSEGVPGDLDVDLEVTVPPGLRVLVLFIKPVLQVHLVLGRILQKGEKREDGVQGYLVHKKTRSPLPGLP